MLKRKKAPGFFEFNSYNFQRAVETIPTSFQPITEIFQSFKNVFNFGSNICVYIYIYTHTDARTIWKMQKRQSNIFENLLLIGKIID
jgi:hypothetical protein